MYFYFTILSDCLLVFKSDKNSICMYNLNRRQFHFLFYPLHDLIINKVIFNCMEDKNALYNIKNIPHNLKYIYKYTYFY